MSDQPSSQSLEWRLRRAETELADTRKQLVEAHARLKFLEYMEHGRSQIAFLDNVAEGVVFADQDGVVTYANPVFVHMIGAHSLDEVFHRALPPTLWEQPEARESLFADLQAGCHVHEREWVMSMLDGGRRVVLCSATPIYGDDGRYLGAALVWRDITERRALELELRRQNEAYAALVEELQHNLEVLRTTQDSLMAEANLAFASSLSSNLLHELSNAISVIEVRAYFLERIAETDATLQISVHKIREATERVAALADSLRNLPRHREAARRFDLREALSVVLEDLQDGHVLDECEVEVLQPESPLVVQAHRSQVQQAIRNIVVNASEALARLPADAPKRLKLRLSTNGTFSAVDVSDNGPGFDPQVVQRLFQPGNSTKSVGGHVQGLGLGLFIAHQVAEVHGGQIHVSSQPGTGATVTFKLPLRSGPRS